MVCASASHCGLSCISIRAHSVHHTNREHAGCALLSVTGQGRWFCLVTCPAASVSDSCFLYHRPLSLRLFSQLQKQVNICLGVPSQRGTKKTSALSCTATQQGFLIKCKQNWIIFDGSDKIGFIWKYCPTFTLTPLCLISLSVTDGQL